jgi:hypothetical protein
MFSSVVHKGPVPLQLVSDALLPLIDELGDELGGICIVGSAAAPSCRSYGDVDVLVVTLGSWRQRRRRFVGDIELDIFIEPLDGFRRALLSARPSLSKALFQNVKPVYDPKQIIASLCRKRDGAAARTNIGSAPRAPSFRAQCEAADYYRRLKTEENSQVFDYLAGLLVESCMNAIFECNSLFPPSPCKRFEVIKQLDPAAAKLIDDIFSREKSGKRAEAARKLSAIAIGREPESLVSIDGPRLVRRQAPTQRTASV